VWIYLVTNLTNGKVYVGQTTAEVEHRWKEHVWDANRPKLCGSFRRAIRKYGENSFSVTTLNQGSSIEELNRLETFYIRMFRSADPLFGYNLNSGGRKNAIPTYEVRMKLALASTGRKLSPESCEKLGRAHRQRFIDNPALRQKYSEAKKGAGNPGYGKAPWNKGKTTPPEVRAKQSLSAKVRWSRNSDAIVRTHEN